MMRRIRTSALGSMSPRAAAGCRSGSPYSRSSGVEASPLGERRDQRAMGRRAEADRVGERFLQGDAFVRQTRWDIEHVARLQNPRQLGTKAPQDFEIQPRAMDRLGPGVDRPAPPAAALDQEDVVAVDVRSNAAARSGEADHHVVEAPAWDEVEGGLQRSHAANVAIDVLDEQRPVRGL